MRCLACCTSINYPLKIIEKSIREQGYAYQYFQNVLHFFNIEKKEDIFFFQHGCFVSWGLSKLKEQWVLSRLDELYLDTTERKEFHTFNYELAEETNLFADPNYDTDIITIKTSEEKNTLLKLAISYALSKSVKLRSHEISIQKTVLENQFIAEELAKKGRISLGRKAIFKRIGEIFIAKSLINLSNEYLDVSEYFWRYPHLEPQYLIVERFLDIKKRVATLNQRLDVVHDIVLMLNNQLEHRYSSTLEIIIIVLIFAEILLNLLYQFRI